MQAFLVFWQNKTLRYGTLIIIGLILFYLWARAAGKRKGLEQSKNVPIPNNGTDIPANWDPKIIANKLFEVMDGWATTAATKEPAFAQAFGLTDGQLVAVYNTFNFLFGKEGKGTLTKWLRDEWNYSIGGVKNRLIERLVSLNCL